MALTKPTDSNEAIIHDNPIETLALVAIPPTTSSNTTTLVQSETFMALLLLQNYLKIHTRKFAKGEKQNGKEIKKNKQVSLLKC